MSKMNRRHYERVADVFRRHIDQAALDQDILGVLALSAAANDLADVLAQDSPLFDRDRFLQACGLENGLDV